MVIWPKAISVFLWKFTLYFSVERLNSLDIDKFGYIPYEKLIRCRDTLHTEIFCNWGCPKYVLDSRNKSGEFQVPKWEPRSRLGFHLLFSPCAPPPRILHELFNSQNLSMFKPFCNFLRSHWDY